MQAVDQFAASGPPTCRKMGHAALSDMFRGRKEKGGKQLHPTHRQESGEQNNSSSIVLVSGKRGSSSICLLTRKREQVRLHRFVDEKEGKQLHLHDLPVDEKEGNYILSAAARLRRPVGRARFCR